jgi:hypothetical protein
MNRRLVRSLPLAAVVLVGGGLAVAQTVTADDRYIPYSGHLEQQGAPFTGTVDVTFTLYASQASAVALDTAIESVDVAAGRFALDVGPFDDAAFDGAALWMGVSVGGADLGRHQVRAAPFAVRGEVGKPFKADYVAELAAGTVTADTVDATDVVATDVVATNVEAVDVTPETIHFSSTLADKLVLWGSDYGFGIADNEMRTFLAPTAKMTVGTYNATSTFAPGVTITAAGALTTVGDATIGGKLTLKDVATNGDRGCRRIGTKQECWGSITVGPPAQIIETFVKSFADGNYVVLLTPLGSGYSANVSTRGATQFTGSALDSTNAPLFTGTVFYWAMGNAGSSW